MRHSRGRFTLGIMALFVRFRDAGRFSLLSEQQAKNRKIIAKFTIFIFLVYGVFPIT